MAGVPRSPQDMLRRLVTGMAGRQATTSTQDTLTQQQRMGPVHMLPQASQGRQQATMPLAMTHWAEALRYGPGIPLIFLESPGKLDIPRHGKGPVAGRCLATRVCRCEGRNGKHPVACWYIATRVCRCIGCNTSASSCL